MSRRGTVNLTGIERIPGIKPFDAWVGFVCVKCRHQNHVSIGLELLTPLSAYATAKWKCEKCGYVHSSNSRLPFKNWPRASTVAESLPARRFWIGFFRTATEYPSSYWKQCNTCARILPFNAFSRHVDWGPLELQMECRGCKGGINAILNPLRTKEQLHESAFRRRIADLLLQGAAKTINLDDLFHRFKLKCFKCRKSLDPKVRKTWEVDHILPSRCLYPLSVENAALLCVDRLSILIAARETDARLLCPYRRCHATRSDRHFQRKRRRLETMGPRYRLMPLPCRISCSCPNATLERRFD